MAYRSQCERLIVLHLDRLSELLRWHVPLRLDFSELAGRGEFAACLPWPQSDSVHVTVGQRRHLVFSLLLDLGGCRLFDLRSVSMTRA